MPNITYEQFVAWCKYWNYTIDEGFRAVCFASNITGQNFANHYDYAKKVSNDGNHSDEFKAITETFKKDALRLSVLYNDLTTKVFNMLEKHDEEAKEIN